MGSILRCYTEKKPGFDTEADALLDELRNFVGLSGLAGLRLLRRYDVEGMSAAAFAAAIPVVFASPVTSVYRDPPSLSDTVNTLIVESLPGQYDQCADSCSVCLQMLCGGTRPIVRRADFFLLTGLNTDEFERAASYLINPVESRRASAAVPSTLTPIPPEPGDIPVLSGFTGGAAAPAGLAMDAADLSCARDYFRSIGREPTLAELYVLDTYWSDHCRHTTFLTRLKVDGIEDIRVREAFDSYMTAQKEIYGDRAADRPVSLMEIATAGMKLLKKRGKLPWLDESEEINACSIRVPVEVGGKTADVLLMYKNETHNHPTEIEPYGGAGTCLGGGIRDPLAGRAYVYQAMRVTGAADPRTVFHKTLPGKIPQRKLTRTAAAGYSSYGNQIGLASGPLHEFYHPGYAAKRMELGALIGSVPADWVRRECPSPGDSVLLIGGRTGRDGLGGATGSSREQTSEAVAVNAAEVQKGDPLEERKIVRLFRRPEAARLIKRCNDFGAGGVSVAVGELADGLDIDLDAVPVKYAGLSGLELAISESQERMAVVVSRIDEPAMRAFCEEEGVACTRIAVITEEPHMIMRWRGKIIVDLDRTFLNSHGAPKAAEVRCEQIPQSIPASRPASLRDHLADLRYCSRKGLSERFGGTIGGGAVLAAYGGISGRTPVQVMAARIPVGDVLSETVSVMAFGFDPYRSETDVFGGSASSVLESVAKLVAAGVSPDTIYLSFQEYFKSPRGDSARWGEPFAALLGAFAVQCGIGIAAIGGKDSMSGSYQDLDVPPTLVSFAVGTAAVQSVLSPEFKGANHTIRLFAAPAGDYAAARALWEDFHKLCSGGQVLAAYALEPGGLARAVSMMALGGETGVAGAPDVDWLAEYPGAIVAEMTGDCDLGRLIGVTTADRTVHLPGFPGEPVHVLADAWESTLEEIFPTRTRCGKPLVNRDLSASLKHRHSAGSRGKPLAVVPVFPGTNGEIDVCRALERAGASVKTVLIRNLTPFLLAESAESLVSALERAQMVVLPGGFSGGEAFDGSGKFGAAFLRDHRITEALYTMLYTRDGLLLGLGEGFQTLLALGLLPGGRVSPPSETGPTLAANLIGRHQSRYVNTVVCTALSPWLSRCAPGAIYTVPICTGAGRFVCPPDILETIRANGQLAFRYVGLDGRPSTETRFDPTGSDCSVEGICSPDGRILGKTAYSERWNSGTAINVPGEKFQPIFEGGTCYFL